MLPDLGRARAELDVEPKRYFGHLRAPTAIVIPPEVSDRAEGTLRSARTAVDEVRSRGLAADLSKDQAAGLEAVIHTVARPAIPIQHGSFPAVDPDQWWAVLDEHRRAVEAVIASVGRVEIVDDPTGRTHVGTGFVAAPGVIATNRHVVAKFAAADDRGTWRLLPEVRVRIDFAEELDAVSEPLEFEVTKVLSVGAGDRRDLAFLGVRRRSAEGRRLPQPLPLSAAPSVRKGSAAYVVGYPAFDPANNSVFDVEAVFAGKYDVKRLQPGYVMGVRSRSLDLMHDCSTLGGNSGSCLVELRSGAVVGIHRQGVARVANYALPLWPIKDESFVTAAGLAFG